MGSYNKVGLISKLHHDVIMPEHGNTTVIPIP